MDGLVLHFDEAKGSGLIRASDGSRYGFETGDWHSPEAPGAGAAVDFVADGERATEIYLVRRDSAGAQPLAPAREEPGSYLRARPGLPWAGAMLLSCFLPFLAIPFFSASLLTLPSTISFYLNLATAFGGDSNAAEVRTVRFALWSLYLLYLVPAAAAFLIYRELQLEAGRRLRLAVGLAGLLTPFAVSVLFVAIVASARPDRPGASPAPGPGNPLELGLNVTSFMGAGWVLLILASAGLVAAGFGWNPLGRSR